eukprot:3640760-Pyramimonas_sp.AAC.1
MAKERGPLVKAWWAVCTRLGASWEAEVAQYRLELPRRHGWTRLEKFVSFDPGRGLETDFERICPRHPLSA